MTVGVVSCTTMLRPNSSASSPVASFSSDSPSRVSTMRAGMPTLRAIAEAATASVGETIAPSRNARRGSNDSNRCGAIRVTPTMVNVTRPSASIATEMRL